MTTKELAMIAIAYGEKETGILVDSKLHIGGSNGNFVPLSVLTAISTSYHIPFVSGAFDFSGMDGEKEFLDDLRHKIYVTSGAELVKERFLIAENLATTLSEEDYFEFIQRFMKNWSYMNFTSPDEDMVAGRDEGTVVLMELITSLMYACEREEDIFADTFGNTYFDCSFSKLNLGNVGDYLIMLKRWGFSFQAYVGRADGKITISYPGISSFPEKLLLLYHKYIGFNLPKLVESYPSDGNPRTTGELGIFFYYALRVYSIRNNPSLETNEYDELLIHFLEITSNHTNMQRMFVKTISPQNQEVVFVQLQNIPGIDPTLSYAIRMEIDALIRKSNVFYIDELNQIHVNKKWIHRENERDINIFSDIFLDTTCSDLDQDEFSFLEKLERSKYYMLEVPFIHDINQYLRKLSNIESLLDAGKSFPNEKVDFFEFLDVCTRIYNNYINLAVLDRYDYVQINESLEKFKEKYGACILACIVQFATCDGQYSDNFENAETDAIKNAEWNRAIHGMIFLINLAVARDEKLSSTVDISMGDIREELVEKCNSEEKPEGYPPLATNPLMKVAKGDSPVSHNELWVVLASLNTVSYLDPRITEYLDTHLTYAKFIKGMHELTKISMEDMATVENALRNDYYTENIPYWVYRSASMMMELFVILKYRMLPNDKKSFQKAMNYLSSFRVFYDPESDPSYRLCMDETESLRTAMLIAAEEYKGAEINSYPMYFEADFDLMMLQFLSK